MTGETADETRQCPSCGTINESSRQNCKKCGRMLPAFDGRPTTPEIFERRLAVQAAAAENRPPIVPAMVVFTILIALFWPLRTVWNAFTTQPTVNAEGTNYVTAAVGSVGPFFVAAIALPVAIAIVVVAWATWAQQTWAWTAAVGVSAIFFLFHITHFTSVPVLAMLIGAVTLAYLWFKPEVKGWFGLT